MPPDDDSSLGIELLYQGACAALIAHAFRHNGYLTATALRAIKLSASPEAVDRALLSLRDADLLHIIHPDGQKVVYDLLPALEKTVAEDRPLGRKGGQFQLARILCRRKLWTQAIAELRSTRKDLDFQKVSLYLLGQCFEHKGAFQKACEQYEHLLALDYGYRDTLARLRNLRDRQGLNAFFATTHVHLELPPALHERYELLRELGRGGAGVVYQAIDLKLRRDVALKFLYDHPGQSQDDMAAILHEARLAAQLEHPTLIDVYDVNTEARCIIMEFVGGGTLRTRLHQSERLTVEHARSIIIQLCQGLQVAHAAGVLHRDIKPANIFFTPHQTIKLGDFGIAHTDVFPPACSARMPAIIGTLPYMSPEQLKGDPLTTACDIYALGIVFYEMLTGAPPFTRGDISYHHQYTLPKPPGLSEALDTLVLRCLAKDPLTRFQSVEELRCVLQQHANDEHARLDTYRELLKIALLDKDISEQELLLLKHKRQSLGISDHEAQQIEADVGLKIPL